MGSKSSLKNFQPAAQTQAGNPVVVNIDGYKSRQSVNINNEVVDFGAVGTAFAFAEDALNDVLSFADEAKDQAFAAASRSAVQGAAAQDLAFLALENGANRVDGDSDSGRIEKVGLWSLGAVVAVALLPYWLNRVGN